MNQHYEVTITRREYAELLPIEVEEQSALPGHIGGSTLASLISAGTEIGFAYQGETFPFAPGYAAVFQVEEIGEGVDNFQTGDLALAMGHHRSWQNHPASECWKIPTGLEPCDATFARLMGVSMSTLTTTTARPPDKVLITGLGPVGHLAAQIFGSCGYRVFASDPDATRRELAIRGGIENIGSAPDESWRGEVALALECSGHEAAALMACEMVKKRGEVVLVGVPWKKRTELSAHELLHAVFHRYAVLRSGWEWEVARHESEFRSGSIRANIEAALQWLSTDKVRVQDLYSVYNPRDCQEAYQALLHAQEKNLAIVFNWTK